MWRANDNHQPTMDNGKMSIFTLPYLAWAANVSIFVHLQVFSSRAARSIFELWQVRTKDL